VPFDERCANEPSGIRIGTPTVTSRGMKETAVIKIAECIDKVLSNPKDIKVKESVKKTVKELCSSFPLYEEETCQVAK
ncbi:MAG: serine hydroxymethyltransferase, partial [Planctomycetota bacterium]